MQGVEILTSMQVVTETAFNWQAFWIVSGVVAALSFIVTLLNVLEDISVLAVIVLAIVSSVAGCMGGLITCGENAFPTAYETQYKVTISEEVPMVEFNKHYEVIEQDGKIFTVREKENESN